MARQLQATERTRARRGEEGSVTPDTPKRLCVLVVDDREDLRRLVVRALSGRGFDVDAAADGAAALALVERGISPDLVLCDVRMPGMSGPALVQALRGRGATMPVLYMTGQHDARLDLGPADGVLAKPFTIEELVSMVRRTMPASTARATPGETPVGWPTGMSDG